MAKRTKTAKTQEQLRISAGIQCPECFGVNVQPRMSRFQAQPEGFSCHECGCQWGADYFPRSADSRSLLPAIEM